MSPPRSDARRAYEAWHAGLGVALEPDSPWHQMIRERLEPARDLGGRRLLEIGCGRGDFACWLARRQEAPRRVLAVDFSATAVAMGRALASQLGLDNVGFAVADIQAIPTDDGCFDTVISCETIEHTPRPAVAVAELARVLAPGGRLFLSTPNYANVWALYRAFLRLTGRRFSEAGQPINRLMLAPRTVSMVRRAGLSVTSFDGCCHSVPSWPGRPARPLPGLEGRRWARWLGQQTLVVAEKA